MNPLAQFSIPNKLTQQATPGNTDILPIYDKDNKNVIAYRQKAKNGNVVKAIKNL
jgi:hypothetical protein